MNHLTHIEDFLFEGEPGIEKISQVFSDLKNKKFEHFSLKIDGSPAVFVGVDPNDGKKFVTKKSIFNKTPIVYKSHYEIDLHIKKQELNELLKYIFDTINVQEGCYQGDFLFLKKDLKTIHETDLSFHANVLLYSIDNKSSLHEEIQSSDLGIVFHTYYNILDGFKLELKKFKHLKIERVFQFPLDVDIEFSSDFIPKLYEVENRSKSYYNQFIRKNDQIPILSEFDQQYISIMNVNKELLSKIKSDYNIYFKKGIEYIPTSHEGLVYNNGDFCCKIINRREFSHANFSELFLKGWS